MKSSADTPMMRQYRTFKEQYPDRLMFFRMGDFFELFFEDAERVSQLLDIALTRRGDIPMAGVPAHSVDNYLARLLKKGESVVLCDQVGTPGKTGQLVERQITRIMTPGTLSEEELLPAGEDNLVAAACQVQALWGIAWLDISGGRIFVTEPQTDEELLAEISRRPPAELIVPADRISSFREGLLGTTDPKPCLTERPEWEFDAKEGRLRLLEKLAARNLSAWDCNDLTAGLGALGALLCYAAETLRTEWPLNLLLRERSDELLFIDPATRASLEIDRSLSGDSQATLLAVLDSCSTPMGSRLLRQRLQTPTRQLKVLHRRHDAIAHLIDHPELDLLRRSLRPLGDLSRALTRIHLGTAPPRDLLRLRNSLNALPDIAKLTAECPPLVRIPEPEDALRSLGERLNLALVENPPATVRDGGVIADHYDTELDAMRNISGNSSRALEQMEVQERKRTGIQQLRAGYNRIHGYFLEIPRTRIKELPPEYVVRQTLKNTQRYVTADLKKHEEAVLSSRARALEKEKMLYRQLLEHINLCHGQLQQTADLLAELDFLASQAERAIQLRLRRPQFTDQPEIHIGAGRHPVVEHLQQSAFTPNDLELNDQRRLLLITGPNMGGKSTYMRQTALLVLMAHAGCFVAAEKAVIGPVDRLLTRIGASDRLGRGQSTFMVEMTEVAYLLRNASEQSLVLLDEVGRGTGTRDGLALSWACLQWFGREQPGFTLFATHFAELTDAAETLPMADNIHFDAEQRPDSRDIRFLHRAEAGPTSRSYGLAVALLAGVPESFYQLADEHFRVLEQQAANLEQRARQGELFELPPKDPPQPPPPHEAIRMLESLNPEDVSPLQALEYLYALKKLL